VKKDNMTLGEKLKWLIDQNCSVQITISSSTNEIIYDIIWMQPVRRINRIPRFKEASLDLNIGLDKIIQAIKDYS